MNKAKVFLDCTRVGLRVAEALFRGDLRVSGAEDLPPGPRLYVANHFTRFETVVLPYLIDRATGRYPHSLADVGLFSGPVGAYFDNMGVMSTKAADRDTRVVRDLLTGAHDWIVYPEGQMMKTRQIIRGRKLVLHTPRRVGPPHTGAAVWALKSDVYRRAWFRAVADDDTAALAALRERFGIGPGDVQEQHCHVIPVTITFYPLRPGENCLVRTLRRAIHRIPDRSREELEIEGNLALGETTIDVHFGEPVAVRETLGGYRTISRFLPFLRDVETRNPLIGAAADKLAHRFMTTIYDNIQINLDHVAAGLLRSLDRSTLRESNLRRAIYLAVQELKDDSRVRLHPDLLGDLAPHLNGGRWPQLESLLRMGERQGVLRLKRGVIAIRRERLDWQPRFHSARVRNTLHVLANAASAQGVVMAKLRRIAKLTPDELRAATVTGLVAADLRAFEREYAAHCDNAGLCLNPANGRPIYLPAEGDLGVVLSHGFLSSPAEVRPLAEYLHSQGLTVYVPRLAGHGLRPSRLGDVSMEDWLRAYETAYAVVRGHCRHVILGGFSTGGLLALAAATRFPARAVFAISPPIFMRHIGAVAAPIVDLWNRLLTLMHVSWGRYDEVASTPENPHLNYSRIHVRALAQLHRLMRLVRAGLPSISIPTLILQGDHDPVVNPASAHWIHDALRTQDKVCEEVSSDRHVVVLGADADQVYRRIGDFIFTLHPPTELPAVSTPNTRRSA